MSNQYTPQSISGYNSSPPPDDGSQSDDNEITWAKHKTKLSDPIKTLSEAIDTELTSAFGKVFGNNVSAQTTTFNVTSSDQGKLFTVTNSVTADLVAAATASTNFTFMIFNAGAGTVTIDPNGSETINGAATLALAVGDGAIVVSDGTNWHALTGGITGTGNLANLASPSTARTNLGLAIGTDVQAYDAQLADLASISTTANNFIVANGSSWTAETPSAARTSLGLGALAVKGAIDETDLDWPNSDGISQMNWSDPSLTTTTSVNTLTTIHTTRAYIPANATSLEYQIKLGDPGATSPNAHARLTTDTNNGTTLDNAATTIDWTGTGTLTISDKSGYTDINIQMSSTASSSRNCTVTDIVMRFI